MKQSPALQASLRGQNRGPAPQPPGITCVSEAIRTGQALEITGVMEALALAARVSPIAATNRAAARFAHARGWHGNWVYRRARGGPAVSTGTALPTSAAVAGARTERRCARRDAGKQEHRDDVRLLRKRGGAGSIGPWPAFAGSRAAHLEPGAAGPPTYLARQPVLRAGQLRWRRRLPGAVPVWPAGRATT